MYIETNKYTNTEQETKNNDVKELGKLIVSLLDLYLADKNGKVSEISSFEIVNQRWMSVDPRRGIVVKREGYSTLLLESYHDLFTLVKKNGEYFKAIDRLMYEKLTLQEFVEIQKNPYYDFIFGE